LPSYFSRGFFGELLYPISTRTELYLNHAPININFIPNHHVSSRNTRANLRSSRNWSQQVMVSPLMNIPLIFFEIYID
jgi:hypothetical protein